MALKQYQSKDVLKLEKTAFGLNAVAFHHIQKAKQASDRMKINVQANNASLVMYEAAQVAAAVEEAYNLLADDNNILTDSKKTGKSKN